MSPSCTSTPGSSPSPRAFALCLARARTVIRCFASSRTTAEPLKPAAPVTRIIVEPPVGFGTSLGDSSAAGSRLPWCPAPAVLAPDVEDPAFPVPRPQGRSGGATMQDLVDLVEPTAGLEPATYGLRNRCSTD